MQPTDIQTLISDENQDRPGTDRVDHHMAVAAPGHGFTQRALANLAGHSLRERQPGSRQCGEILRINTTGILLDDQAITARHSRPGDPGYSVLQCTHLREQWILIHAGPSLPCDLPRPTGPWYFLAFAAGASRTCLRGAPVYYVAAIPGLALSMPTAHRVSW
jgi:hypothetical protein